MVKRNPDEITNQQLLLNILLKPSLDSSLPDRNLKTSQVHRCTPLMLNWGAVGWAKYVGFRVTNLDD